MSATHRSRIGELGQLWRYTLAVQTDLYGKGEASVLFTETGYDRSYNAAVVGSRILARLCSRVELPDTIELATDRPNIIAANHSSLFDLIAALIVLGNYGIPARIGVNSRFFSNPIAGRFLRSIGCIPFSKDDKEAAESAMADALLAQQSAAIMPEGRITRPKDQINGVGQGRPGVSRVARRAGAAVVPVGFAFADEAWVPGTPLPKPRLGRHKVIANIGAPIYFDTDDHIGNANELMSAIGDLVTAARTTGELTP